LNRFRTLIVLAIALVAALAISACGGDSGGDEDPQEVLDATFDNQETIDSGTFDLSFDVTAEGGSDAGTLNASIGGPFQSGGDGELPSFDIDGELDLDSESQDFSGSAGITSTGDSAFVNFQDTDYEVPADLFSQFKSSYEEAQAQTEGNEDANLLAGVDPSNWLTDLENEGNEDVEGTETIHISGQADTPKLVEDLKALAERVPQAAQQVTPAQLDQLDQLTDVIESAEVDIYTGADDDVLRKLEANLAINPPEGEGSPDSLDFGFTLTLGEIGEPQEIAAPSGAQPLGDLLQQFGVDPSQLGALGAASGGGSAGGGSSSGGGASSSASQAFLDCLATAQGAEAVEECNALLGQ
jgi:hypothetical protein